MFATYAHVYCTTVVLMSGLYSVIPFGILESPISFVWAEQTEREGKTAVETML